MTLTQTAILTKQIIAISIIAITVGIISFVSYKIWYAYYLSTLPPVEEKPDTKFSILPPPQFPKVSVSSSNFSYTLDTTTGGLPKIGQDSGFEKIIKVYFVIKPYATFLSADKSQALAVKFNITNPPKVLNETTYEFKQDSKTLIVDLDSGNFKYSNETPFSPEQSPDTEERLVSNFIRILESLGVLKEEVKEGKSKVTVLNANTKEVLISVWPKDLDKKPIFASDVNKSPISATVRATSANLENYLSLDFTYYQIDTQTFATYPIKSSEAAFSDLKLGKGVVVVEPQRPQVSISSVSLGYFLPEGYSTYIQPVFVFEGPHFLAYVSAILSEFQKQD